MKKTAILALAILFFHTADAQTDTTKKNPDAYIEVTNGDYDLGKTITGKSVEFNVYIKNISKDTLVIRNVVVGCGCTTPKYKAQDKIFPGKTTFISLGFNGNASGEFTKTADIVFNNGMVRQVKFHGIAGADVPVQ